MLIDIFYFNIEKSSIIVHFSSTTLLLLNDMEIITEEAREAIEALCNDESCSCFDKKIYTHETE